MKLELTDPNKKLWTLDLDDRERLSTPQFAGAAPLEVSRFDFPKQVQLLPFGRAGIVAVQRDKTRVTFRLEPEQYVTVDAFLGPPIRRDCATSSGTASAGRSRSALPSCSRASARISVGGLLIADVWAFSLGLSLGLLGTLSKFLPHRAFFLLDSAWMA